MRAVNALAVVALLAGLVEGLPLAWGSSGAAALGLLLLSAGGWMLALQLAGVASLALVRLVRLERRTLRWALRGVGVTGIGAALTWGAPPEAVRGPLTRFGLTPYLVMGLEAASDGDGDGSGDAFGGLDCDDDDPRIHPGAQDVPRNGVDENCMGGDAGAPFDRVHLPAGPAPRGRPNIVLLVLDSVRADALGRGLTPNLDRLAARGAVFTQARAPSSSTRGTVPALLSGRWISHTRFAETVDRQFYLDREVPVVPEALHARGYRTAAIVPPYIHRRFHGLRRGFERFERTHSFAAERAARWHTAPAMTERAIELLDRPSRRPLFLYVHYYDCHARYTDDDVPEWVDLGARTPRDLYNGEVARLDRDLGPLLDRLEQTGRPTLVAITADHGEAFGEHGHRYHARSVFGEVVRVPLVLAGPGIEPRRLDTPVDLLDLGVTLAHSGGSSLPGASGDSLWGVLRGMPTAPDRPLFSELRLSRAPYPVFAAVVRWPYKLHARWDTRRTWLFDLSRDPGETVDLLGKRPEVGAELFDVLVRWAEVGSGPGGILLPRGSKPR